MRKNCFVLCSSGLCCKFQDCSTIVTWGLVVCFIVRKVVSFCDYISSSHVECANICVMELWTLSKKLYYVCLRKCVHTLVYEKYFLQKLLEADVCFIQNEWFVTCWIGTGVWNVHCYHLGTTEYDRWVNGESQPRCVVYYDGCTWPCPLSTLSYRIFWCLCEWFLCHRRRGRTGWCVGLVCILHHTSSLIFVMNVSDCYSPKFAVLLQNYLNIAWMSSAMLPFCCAVIKLCEVVLGFLHLALSFEWGHAI
jgi:hypothetical protein